MIRSLFPVLRLFALAYWRFTTLGIDRQSPHYARAVVRLNELENGTCR